LLLTDAITSASRSRKSQTNVGAESLKTSRVPAEINENIMSSSILSELKNSNTSSNNSTERKTSSNEQNTGLISLDPGRVQDIEASAKASVSTKLSKNQSNATSNRSSENIKTHQSSGVGNALEVGVTQESEKMHGLVRTVHATQLSSKKSAASQLPNLLGTNTSNNSTNKNSKTKETKEAENMAGLVRTVHATQLSSKKSEASQLPNLLEINRNTNSTNTKATKEAENMAGLVRTIQATQLSSKTSESYQFPNHQSQRATNGSSANAKNSRNNVTNEITKKSVIQSSDTMQGLVRSKSIDAETLGKDFSSRILAGSKQSKTHLDEIEIQEIESQDRLHEEISIQNSPKYQDKRSEAAEMNLEETAESNVKDKVSDILKMSPFFVLLLLFITFVGGCLSATTYFISKEATHQSIAYTGLVFFSSCFFLTFGCTWIYYDMEQNDLNHFNKMKRRNVDRSNKIDVAHEIAKTNKYSAIHESINRTPEYDSGKEKANESNERKKSEMSLDIESELEKRKEMRQLSITLIIMSALLLIGDGILLEFHNQMPSKEETVRIQFRDSTIGMINWLLVSAVIFCFFQYGAKSIGLGYQKPNRKSEQIIERSVATL